jgi:DNA ligase-1
MTSFRYFAEMCAKIETIPGSLEMTDVVAGMLKEVDEAELPVVTNFVMGAVFPPWSSRLLGVGNRTLYTALAKSAGISEKDVEDIIRKTGDIGKTAVEALSRDVSAQLTFDSYAENKRELTILEVFERLDRIAGSSGKKSQAVKVKNLQYLFNATSPVEAHYLSRLVVEEMRIGVGEGIVRDAIAKAFEIPVETVERAFMLTNDLGTVAAAGKRGGTDEVAGLGIRINRPIKMMLAQVTPNIESAINDIGELAVEWKFDGARVQIHRDGDSIRIFSRRLEDVTASLPDIVAAVREQVKTESVILDGEAVAVDENGRPRAFQEILKRFRRKYDVESTIKAIPLSLNIFDILYLDGKSLLDESLKERRKKLDACVENDGMIRVDTQEITDDPAKIRQIYEKALEAGHEGIMLKNPDAPYSPGKRGKNWLKKKPIMETLDLVVIGAEWGHGRRANLIGSYALACYDPDSGNYLPIGKVATGFTDEKLAELTELFSDLIVFESGTLIELRPEIVFEIAFEEIQKSTNYESGYALRFPRLVGVREDKAADEAETLERIRRIYESQRS